MNKPAHDLVGRRVVLERCNDPYTKIPPGTEGTIQLVDSIGTVHVKWDNGSHLGLCREDGDRWVVLPENTRSASEGG